MRRVLKALHRFRWRLHRRGHGQRDARLQALPIFRNQRGVGGAEFELLASLAQLWDSMGLRGVQYMRGAVPVLVG